MKKILLLIALMFFLTGGTCIFAQEKKPQRFSVSVLPMHLLSGSAKLEFEYGIGKQGNSFSIAPQYYFAYLGRNVKNKEEEVNKFNFQGYGLEAQHRIFLSNLSGALGEEGWRGYVSYGAAYYTFENRFNAYVWYPYTYDGLSYITYGKKEVIDRITRWKFSMFTGIQKRTDNVVFEAYVGMAFQNATIKSDYKGLIDYDKNFWQYGSVGLMPRLGVKLGVFLF